MIIYCQSKEEDSAMEEILNFIRTKHPNIEVTGKVQEDCVVSDSWGVYDVETNLGEIDITEDDYEAYKLWSSLSDEEKIKVVYRLERTIYSDDFYSMANTAILENALEHIQSVIRERRGDAV